jgi:two-component system, OmpR family, response regulator CpxR
MSNTILIADKDGDVADILKPLLKEQGLDIDTATDGESALKKALNQNYKAIVLDILLSKMNGLQVLEQMRKQSETPVLMLTSRQNELDKVLCFELGADDFLAKPSSPRELVARLKAIIKRSQTITPSKPKLEAGPIAVDASTRTATLNGEHLELTNTEFNILEMLMKSPEQAFSKEELTEYALHRAFTAYDRSIDVHISNLRHKLGENKAGEDWIKTVRGFGYTFNA